MNTKNTIQRKIKSFVRRQGRMTQSQQQAIDSYWHCFGLDLSKDAINFTEIFGNSNPVNLEIGFGMGASLHYLAKQYPDHNFLGIEVHRPGVGSLINALAEDQLSNVKIICEDAVEVCHSHIPDSSLEKVLIYFPDPWPKKRHHKRRIIQPDFIQLIHRKLQPEGIIHLATDWEEYAIHMLKVMEAAEGFESNVGKGQFAKQPNRPETKFERRGKQLGHGVWDLIYKSQK